MQDANRLTPAEWEMEQALRQLRPLPAQIDRDRLMFEAGRRSMRRSLTAWRATTAGLAAGVGLLLTVYPWSGPSTGDSPGDTRQPVTMVSQEPNRGNGLAEGADRDYLNLRTRLLIEGPDALTTSDSAEPAPPDPNRKTRDPYEDEFYPWRSQGRS